MSNDKSKQDSLVLTKTLTKLKKPNLFKVILLNDDYTPMEYVVLLLKKVFNKSESQAVKIMLAVHEKGSGVCGVYTLEIAETKVKLVSEMARNDQHPLKCILEKE
ncbi:MAG: ATP-dependent Clp protease adapter ClpS [Rickettsiales bacterium]|jgi:ATP-dependent Clp protease adaptor protein ClpS|nr:ATP-dependent Clp protease adapter ClpS [Rickettsiales bacterium]|tara:strand:+ start:631 stop:945 length:315 start_codon:yes stop_codon:yes gene_type:complete